MKLNVPLHIQSKGSYDCGPLCLQMIFDFFGEKYSLDAIKEKTNAQGLGVTITIDLAKVAKEFGFASELWTKQLINEENFELDYYKEHTDGENKFLRVVKELAKECVRLGVPIKEQSVELKKVLSRIKKNSLAIIILDWGVIKGVDKQANHFVVITGYDKEFVYVNQPGPANPQANMAISYELFDKARKSPGTDEDVVFISPNAN